MVPGSRIPGPKPILGARSLPKRSKQEYAVSEGIKTLSTSILPPLRNYSQTPSMTFALLPLHSVV
jgi:hypothetical protein